MQLTSTMSAVSQSQFYIEKILILIGKGRDIFGQNPEKMDAAEFQNTGKEKKPCLRNGIS